MRRKKMVACASCDGESCACDRLRREEEQRYHCGGVCEQCGGEHDRDGFRREHGPG